MVGSDDYTPEAIPCINGKVSGKAPRDNKGDPAPNAEEPTSNEKKKKIADSETGDRSAKLPGNLSRLVESKK